MKLPASHLRPTSAAAAPVAAAMRSLGAALLAASVLSSQPLTPSALAAPPTAAELSRIAEGLARIDYLLDNWDALTTVCKGYDETAAKQLTRTTGDSRCTKSPLRVQQFIGAASTLDPLFKADKVMIRAEPLVDPSNADRYANAVDLYITKQQISSTMAYARRVEKRALSGRQRRCVDGGPLRALGARVELPCARSTDPAAS